MKNKMKAKNGFSLVELLVSLSIIAIVVVAFVPVFNGSLSNLINSGKRSSAINIAQKNIEDAVLAGTNLSTYTMNLNFKAEGMADVPISISGLKVNASFSYSDLSGNLTVFVPKNN